MVESLSKLALFFRHGNKSNHHQQQQHPLKKSYLNEFGSCPTTPQNQRQQRIQLPQRENKQVIRSPSLGRKRWSSMHQKRQMKDKTRLSSIADDTRILPSRIPVHKPTAVKNKPQNIILPISDHLVEAANKDGSRNVKVDSRHDLQFPLAVIEEKPKPELKFPPKENVQLKSTSHDQIKNSKLEIKICLTDQGRIVKSANRIDSLIARLKYATNGMEAFVVLFQRLTEDEDVFSLSKIKGDLVRYKEDWLKMKLKLEEASVGCLRLKQEIEKQKLLYDQKLEELRSLHSTQLDNLSELHNQELEFRSDAYEQQLREYEDKIRNRELVLHNQFEDALRRIQQQAGQRLISILEETKNQVELLKLENSNWKQNLISESYKKLKEVENRFNEKFQRMEENYISQLEKSSFKEKKRNEISLSSSNEKLNVNYEHQCKAKSKLETVNSTEQVNSKPSDPIQNWEEEICSLRAVLDLKNSEIQELRRQNEKLETDAQDLPFVIQKLDSAQARIEDLNVQLKTKTQTEQKLIEENRKLLEIIQCETEKRKRLVFQNEELLWKLKRSAQVARTLAGFNNCSQLNETGPEKGKDLQVHGEKIHKKQLRRSQTEVDLKLLESNSTIDDGSPKVLGVVEKNDSVSWVLEMDESPTAVASRMLRRAHSLRGISSTKRRCPQNSQFMTLPWRKMKSSTDAAKEEDSKNNILNESSDSKRTQERISADIASIYNFLRNSHLSDKQAGRALDDGLGNPCDSCAQNQPFHYSSGSSHSSSFESEFPDQISYRWPDQETENETSSCVKLISDISGLPEPSANSEWIENFLAPPHSTVENKFL